jgi:hypothetical protein
LPEGADGWSDTWNVSVPTSTDPVSTAVARMVVWPIVPVAGEEVTAMVKPSTLPVAGRAGAVEVVVVESPIGVEALVVVVAADPEFEHPAARGSARTSSDAAAKDAVREVWIGSPYAARIGRSGYSGPV